MRTDGRYLIHAGTFELQESIDKQVSRFTAKGMKFRLQTVPVTKKLYRIRFGRFATQAEAEAAARKGSEFRVEFR